jgi:DNA repair protein RecO (recombination protein O)
LSKVKTKMLKKTRGIVINYIPFRETSIIVKIFTEQFGTQSYIENGVRSSKSKNKIALFQPLTLLDLVVYQDEKKSIHRISEIKCHTPFHSIPFEFAKSSIALFITEILGKTLKEETSNEPLFQFLFESILWLDDESTNFQNFHIQFLLHYARFFGFLPQEAHEISHELTIHNLPSFDKSQEDILNILMESDYNFSVKIGRNTRSQLLETLIIFFKLHIESISELKSLQILKELMQ